LGFNPRKHQIRD